MIEFKRVLSLSSSSFQGVLVRIITLIGGDNVSHVGSAAFWTHFTCAGALSEKDPDVCEKSVIIRSWITLFFIVFVFSLHFLSRFVSCGGKLWSFSGRRVEKKNRSVEVLWIVYNSFGKLLWNYSSCVFLSRINQCWFDWMIEWMNQCFWTKRCSEWFNDSLTVFFLNELAFLDKLVQWMIQ